MRLRPLTVVGGVAAVLAAAALTTGPLYRIRTWWSYEDPLRADAFVVSVYVAIAVAGVVVLATGRRWRRVDPVAGVLAVALIAWLALGALWSDEPATTARESVLAGGALVAGAGLASVVPGTIVLLVLWAGVHLGLAWSAVLIAARSPGTQTTTGEWVGVYFNRNSLALYAALGVLLCVLLLFEARRQLWTDGRQRVALTVLGLAAVADVVLLVQSRALTPMVALALAIVATLAAAAARGAAWPRRRPGRAVSLAGAAVLASALFVWVVRDPILSVAGRRSDLTGRVGLWDASWEWLQERPLLGHGYLGAWSEDDFWRYLVATNGRAFDSAHSSFVDVLLGGGWIGFVLFAAFVVGLYWTVANQALATPGQRRLWPLALFVFVLVENLVETLFVAGQLTVAILGVLLVTRPPVAPPSTAPSLVEPDRRRNLRIAQTAAGP
ncbi:MAG: O-antigen ligase family protein [Ilumatobacteraceae bacterium]